MNYKSYINEMLKLKPIVNNSTFQIFFYPRTKELRKMINSYSTNHFWTWTIPDGKDFINQGAWLFDRNAYVITEKPWTNKKKWKLEDSKSYQLLPRDFKIIQNYEEGLI